MDVRVRAFDAETAAWHNADPRRRCLCGAESAGHATFGHVNTVFLCAGHLPEADAGSLTDAVGRAAAAVAGDPEALAVCGLVQDAIRRYRRS
jgi:hypothetical protein